MRSEINASPRSVETVTRASTGSARLSIWLCAVQMVLAYEWLVSGMDKVVNRHFAAQFPTLMRQGMVGNPYGWYTSLLGRIVLPHHSMFAVLVQLGETWIGATLLVGAMLWVWRPEARLTIYVGWATCLALAGAALLTVNYFLQGGTSLPWVDPANAFDAGVDIDVLLPLLSVVLLAANVQVLAGDSARVQKMKACLQGAMSWGS